MYFQYTVLYVHISISLLCKIDKIEYACKWAWKWPSHTNVEWLPNYDGLERNWCDLSGQHQESGHFWSEMPSNSCYTMNSKTTTSLMTLQNVSHMCDQKIEISWMLTALWFNVKCIRFYMKIYTRKSVCQIPISNLHSFYWIQYVSWIL